MSLEQAWALKAMIRSTNDCDIGLIGEHINNGFHHERMIFDYSDTYCHVAFLGI
jgi:hypothetical protein